MSKVRLSNDSVDVGCPVCGGLISTPVVVVYDHTVVRCTECGLLHLRPMPSEESIQAVYQDTGYFKGRERQGYQSYEDLRKVILPHSRRRLRQIESYFPKPGRLLDFGCAAGYFLEVAQAEGWQVSGVELSKDAAERASQVLHVQIPTTLDDLVEDAFDVITMWEVIEHLPKPVVELRRLYDRLRPGGMLMLSTPNAGHWQSLREPQDWTGYRSIPLHLAFFTQHTLQEVLQRDGFERISICKVSPLPPLPTWLRRLSAPLERSLGTGQAKLWPVALLSWRGIRLFGWGWQKVAYRDDDIFATLEAIAFRPKVTACLLVK